MNRHCTMWLLACFIIGCAMVAQAAERPNIIFLMADDQCTYSMGCYGTPVAQTPNLDELAREGMIFDNHYDTTAICMASRASVMTGLFEYRTGCNFENGDLVQDIWEQSYPVLLKKSGYQIAFAGKFGFLIAAQPGTKGQLPSKAFDSWGGGPGQTSYVTRQNASMIKYAEEYPHSTLSYGAFGRDFIRQASDSDKPFCLSISFKAPHQPVQPDPKFADVYAGVTIPKPANYGRAHGAQFSEQSKQGRQYERFESWGYRDKYDQVMAQYFQQIYAIDVAVGMIREALKQSGVADNTVIIYTSDNGFLCGSHGYGSKVLPYEEASRVPMIIFDPRHANSGKQLRCAALTGNVDFAPTILALANVESEKEKDGRDLMELLDNPQAEIHRYLPLVNVWGPKEVHSLAVVTLAGKYIYWPYAGNGFEAKEEYYDMRNDRLELHNLIDRHEYTAECQSARGIYAEALAHWRKEAVDFHGYQRFATIFDPDRNWDEKAAIYAKPKNRKR